MTSHVERNWKSDTWEGFRPLTTDWCRLAAYIDGEGSILINTQKWVVKGKQRKNFALTLRVTVANTDIRLLRWCREKFGGNIHDANTDKYYEGKNWKRSFHWDVSTQHAAWILFNCLSWFVIKREQAEIGIALQETYSEAQRGRELPEGIRQDRRNLKDRLLVLKAKGIRGVPVPYGPISAQAEAS